MGWEQVAAQKRDSVLALIPKEWRIPSPPSIAEQRNVTGSFIQQYLDKKEIEITETDADDIVKKASNGTWSAYEIAQAFCHRAAIAHQLVSLVYAYRGSLGAHLHTGQLPARDLLRPSATECERIGRVSQQRRKAKRSSAWSTSIAQGSIPRQGPGYAHGLRRLARHL